MPSPFPGMDPFIEVSHLWEDFHHSLISEVKNALASRLPENYVVRARERSYTALAVDGPRIQAEYREPFLQINQVYPESRLVTRIEVLSPSNKRARTKGWSLYLRDRQRFLIGHANFVEVDLLRSGKRMPMASDWPDSPYYLLVSCKKQLARCSVWPAYFTRPLPCIPIPLAPPDLDISLGLQPLIETIYARSRYEQDIDYRRPLIPPLSPADSAWLDKRLRQARE
jgi:hypothetical protein